MSESPLLEFSVTSAFGGSDDVVEETWKGEILIKILLEREVSKDSCAVGGPRSRSSVEVSV